MAELPTRVPQGVALTQDGSIEPPKALGVPGLDEKAALTNGQANDGAAAAAKAEAAALTKARAAPGTPSAVPKKRRHLSPPPGAGFGPMYAVMRFVGERCASHFFSRVVVKGGEDVPKEGPIIVVCTHFSTIIDVAIISAHLPHRRPIHYWAKRGLYKRQPFRWILHSSGNIMVDRKTKDNQDLFAGTFEAMKAGEAIGLFPEGGSFTEHRLHGMKAGAAWAALEFAKHLVLEGASNPKQTAVKIVPASINYTEKSRFRSDAIFEFGPAFSVDEYTEEFLSATVPGAVNGAGGSGSYFPSTPGVSGGPQSNGMSANALPAQTPGFPGYSLRTGLDAGYTTTPYASGAATPVAEVAPGGDVSGAKSAVSKLTKRIGAELHRMTIDAPDWTTWHATKMARELIWWKPGMIPMEQFVPISNAFIALFESDDPTANAAKEALFNLQALSLMAGLDVFTLNHLSRQLSPGGARQEVQRVSNQDTLDTLKCESALPLFRQSLALLIKELIALTVRLPLVIPLMLVYAPAYVTGASLSLKYASHEEESMASAKSLCGFVIASLTHILMITIIASLTLFTLPGWVIGVGVSYLIERIHLATIDDTYTRVKHITAAARLVRGSAPLFAGTQVDIKHDAVKTCLSAYASGPPIQNTYNKSLSILRKATKPVWRPSKYRVTGIALVAHANAVEALFELQQAARRGDEDWNERQRHAIELIDAHTPPLSARLKLKSV